MKRRNALILTLLGFLGVSACNSSPAKPDPATSQPTAVAAGQANVEYYCPMHPEVVQNEPGTCPKCKMKLEPRPKPGKP